MTSILFIDQTHEPYIIDHPDHYLIQPDNSTIRIKHIRDLKAWAHLKPFHKTHKIAVIAHLHTASHEAQNALLKLVEEPPNQTQIVLHANDQNNILPTIVSRCHIIHDRETKPHEHIQWNPTVTIPSENNELLSIGVSAVTPYSELFKQAEQISKKDRSDIIRMIDQQIIAVSKITDYSSGNKIIPELILAKERLLANVQTRLVLEQLLLNMRKQRMQT